MKKVATFNKNEREELFLETAARKGMQGAAIEKDFWICWALMKLFEDDDLKELFRFKGGTTLSKCFQVIDRFSEDIDLVLDWSVLTDEDPYEGRSNTQQDIFNKKLNKLAEDYIGRDLLPILNGLMQPPCDARVDSYDGQTVIIQYPKLFSGTYLRPEIRLEIGPISSMVPCSKYSIRPYAAEVFPEKFENSFANVVSIVPERTFWEKVTILHVEAHRPAGKSHPARYSRHYYDVYKMLDTDIEMKGLKNLKLLDDVVNFKKRFYYSNWAKYDLATPRTIKLIPDESRLKSLMEDYEAMEEMIFGAYPTFDHIIDKLRAFQKKLNELK